MTEERRRVYIGLVGMPGAGKGEFVRRITECAARYRLSVGAVRFSDALMDVCDQFGLPKTRKVLQGLSAAMVKLAPETTPVATAARKRAMDLKTDIVVFDGVRWMVDERMLKKLPNSFLVYIIADQETRWRRSRMRAEKPEEETTPFEEFAKNDEAETERHIPEIGKLADFTIDNNGALDELYSRISEFLCQYLGFELT